MIKITKPSDPILVENIVIVIYGEPGTGKSSLGFSADKPLMLDADMGAQRALNRKDVVRIDTWEEIKDITAKDLVNYNTIVIDTLGKICDVIKVNILQNNIKGAKEFSTNSLAPKGYGVLGNVFVDFVLKLKSYKKDIVIISHQSKVSKKVNGVDSVKYELKAPGKVSTDYIYEIADLMGYTYIDDNKRILNFNPTTEHDGKNCPEFPILYVPNLKENSTYLADLIKQAKDKMNAKSAEQIKAEQEFQEVLDDITACETLESLNTMILMLAEGNNLHKQALVKHGESIGFIYDKPSKCFKVKEPVNNDFDNLPQNVGGAA